MTNKSHHVIIVGMTVLLGMTGCLSDEAGTDPDPAPPAATDEAQSAVTSTNHKIVNLAYNQCLDAPHGQLNEVLQLANCRSTSTQLWQFLQVTPGSPTYILRNVWSGLCVEVNNGTATPGELVDAWTCNVGASSEQWVEGFRSIDGLLYANFTHVGTNLCLDTVGGAGSQIMQWTCQGNDAQTWQVR
jgi:hypothetical protein